MNFLRFFPCLAFLGLTMAALISVPKDSTVCTSARWDDFIIFFLTNYFTHAATAVRFPGETTMEITRRRVDLLFAPYTGLPFAWRKIQWSLVLERNPLRRACRGEALVQLIRSCDWQPVEGLRIKAKVDVKHCHSETTIGSPEVPMRYCHFTVRQTAQSGPKPILINDIKRRALVQGLHYVPPGYSILRCQGVPVLQFSNLPGEWSAPYYDHRILESLLALSQVLFAIVTLYKSRGHQFERFGYASFSFTVLPFASMSFTNLVANCLSVDYPLLHFVESPEFGEAKQRGAVCSTIAGRLVPDLESEHHLTEVRFSKSGDLLHAYTVSVTGSPEEDLGQVLSQGEAIHHASIISHLTVPSNIRTLEDLSPLASENKFRNAWMFFRTPDYIGGILSISVAVLLFAAPSVVIGALTHFHSQASVPQRVAILTWIYAQQFLLLFLMLWNVLYDVEHRIKSPWKYSTLLGVGMAFSLRAVALAGYACVIFQIRKYGVCVDV